MLDIDRIHVFAEDIDLEERTEDEGIPVFLQGSDVPKEVAERHQQGHAHHQSLQVLRYNHFNYGDLLMYVG